MKSKKIRKVILKTRWARLLRLNLRTLLKLAVETKLSMLSDLDMWKEKKTLERKFSRSTLQCGMAPHLCVSFQEIEEQDLVWVPWLEKWYCAKCFEENRFSEMTHNDFDDPITQKWVKKEFGI